MIYDTPKTSPGTSPEYKPEPILKTLSDSRTKIASETEATREETPESSLELLTETDEIQNLIKFKTSPEPKLTSDHEQNLVTDLENESKSELESTFEREPEPEVETEPKPEIQPEPNLEPKKEIQNIPDSAPALKMKTPKSTIALERYISEVEFIVVESTAEPETSLIPTEIDYTTETSLETLHETLQETLPETSPETSPKTSPDVKSLSNEKPFSWPDLSDDKDVKKFFIRQLQLGEDYLSQKDFENGVVHLSIAVAVSSDPDSLLNAFHQRKTISPTVYDLLLQNVERAKELVKKQIEETNEKNQETEEDED